MDIAEAAILEKGFGATSIDEVIAAAGITKGGFFYHFPDKNALARALLLRYIEREETLLDAVFGRAQAEHEDPLEAFLAGLKSLAELMDDLPNGHPGCLIATYCYNERLFDQEVRALYTEAMLSWRVRFRAHLDAIVARHPPRDDIDLDALADMVNAIIDGGIVMQRALNDPTMLGKQIMLLRGYIRLLFAEPAAA
nr:TetR/AcrR family transcriptional regulator [Martelella radicis]